MSIFLRDKIRPVVAAAIEQATGRPFTLSSIAAATGLSIAQVFGVINHMLRAGIVSRVGEQHEPGKPGRGTRVYVTSTGTGSAAATPGCRNGNAALVERVRAVVAQFSDRFDFTTTEVAKEAGGCPDDVRWSLAKLEQEGLACPLVEIRPNEIIGRPAKRWTSNADNMATQAELGRRLREIEDG